MFQTQLIVHFTGVLAHLIDEYAANERVVYSDESFRLQHMY